MMERIMQVQEQDATAALAAGDSNTLPADQRLMRWLAYARQRQANRLDTGKTRLLEQAGQCGLTPEALRQGLRQQLGTGLAHDLCQDHAEWRGAKARAIEPEQLAVIDTAMGEVLGHLIPSDVGVTTPDADVRLYRWLIPTLGGGLLGAVFGTQGALIGAAGGVAGVAWLAIHREALAYPIPKPGSDGAPTTHLSAFLRLPLLQGPGYWLRKAQNFPRWLAARLVALVLPPPRTTNATLPSSTIAQVCERAFDLLTIIVFICRTAQADSSTSANPGDADLPITEDSVLRALLALVRTLERQPAEIEIVHDLAEELYQRLEDAGYVWEILPDGTLFQEEHRQRFKTLGLVAPGEPVETLEPCFRRSDTILLPGRITKQRG
jgi:hypothetical protein